MSTHVEEIKEKLDIVSVVGSYIKLEKAGQNFKARCPFHNEKTPSFFVSPERGSFYCFGCQAKGDIFSFVEKFEGLDFMGSLKVLADRAGVKLDKISQSKNNRKEILFEIMERTTSFFEERLARNSSAKAYILGRGLTEKTIENFRVGFAPDDWRQLRSYLKAEGYKDEDVFSAGLIKKTDKAGGDPYYDAFRNRIMFPIGDSSGRIIAFTGRTLDEVSNPPKYLNSPETAIFSKSKTLYGLDKAKSAIRERGYSILVEGQMDLVMSHQAGFTNTVAASGTAFTEDDDNDSAFGLLTRLSENIVLAFDSDSAGQKAVRRIAPALSLGMNVKVVDIKGGKDPADIIRANPKDWTSALSKKKDYIDYLTDIIINSKVSQASVAKLVKQDVFPYIAAIPDDTPRFQAVKRVADKLSLSEDALWKDIQVYVKNHKTNEAGESEKTVKDRKLERLEYIERKVIGLLHSKKYFANDHEKGEEFRKVVGLEKMKYFDALSLDEIAELTLEAEVTYGDGDFKKEWSILLLGLEEEYAKKKLEFMVADLIKAEKAGKDTAELMKDISVISKRIQEVKKTIEKM